MKKAVFIVLLGFFMFFVNLPIWGQYYINVTSPQANDQWIGNSWREITWTSNIDDNLKSFYVSYSTNGGSSWTGIGSIPAGHVGVYSISWALPNPGSTACKVRVACAGVGIYSDSGSFNICGSQLAVSPATNVVSTGTQGGAFSPDSITYTLKNPGCVNTNYSVSINQTWISLSSTSGVLSSNSSDIIYITATLNSSANSLTPGTYVATIVFTNTSNNYGSTTRTFTLTVNHPPHTVMFVEGANGTITGTKVQTVPHGGSTSPVTAVPASGYAFLNWTGGITSTTNPLVVANVTQNMTITANFVKAHTISGKILKDGSPLAGVVMIGLPGNPITNASGIYTAKVNNNWSGTVTPTLPSYTFSPVNRAYTNVTSDQTSQDYIATQLTHTISGRIYDGAIGLPGLAGVTMSGLPGNPTTDANGIYTATVPDNWSGTVTPTLTGYSFSPSSRVYTNVTSDPDQTEQYYIATPPPSPHFITGRITVDGQAFPGVVMNGLPGNPVTNSLGVYTANVFDKWSGKVTPNNENFIFTPASRTYTSVISSQTGQNYSAVALYNDLMWNTFFGKDSDPEEIAIDSFGNIYVVGYSFQTWGNPVRAFSGKTDVFVAKLNSGGDLLWNTFLGGSGNDQGFDIDIDSSGNIVIRGLSYAAWGDPILPYSASYSASFVAKLTSNGSLIWNTFLGNSTNTSGNGIAIGAADNIFIVGSSEGSWGNPIHAHTGYYDIFVAKLSTSGELVWNTFWGSSEKDYGKDIALDSFDNVYISGFSNSSWGEPIRSFSVPGDVFVAKFNSSGMLDWNSFLGTSSTEENIAVDSFGNSYLCGKCNNSWGNPIRAFSGGVTDGWVAKINSSGGLIWNTFLGGSDEDRCFGIAIAPSGNIYISGSSHVSWGSPIRQFSGFYEDAFEAKLNPNGGLIRHMFLGSEQDDIGENLALDSSGSIYLIGRSAATWGSPKMPFTGPLNMYVAKLVGERTFSINGTIQMEGAPVPGVVMSGLPGNPLTDSLGFYSAEVCDKWSGTVIPDLEGYEFLPEMRNYSNIGSHQSSQDYTASAATISISGTIQAGGIPLSGVLLNGLIGDPITDASGKYTATVTFGWSGTVTPTLAGYTFSPTQRIYSGVVVNQADQDYVAGEIPNILAVISPNGGESWNTGENYDITWSSSGTVGNVDILYTYDGGATWASIAVDTANDGSHPWTVPDTSSGNCYVQIREHADGIPLDISDTTFNIVNQHTVTFIEGAGGTITGTKMQTVSHGSSTSEVTAVPNTGYGFVDWTGSYAGTDNPLAIANVTSDMTITANFAINQYTVTFVEGANGTITGNKVQSVNHGSSTSEVTAVANTGYSFVDWTGDYNGTNNPLTIANVTSNMTVTANFTLSSSNISGTILFNSSPLSGVEMNGLPGNPVTNASGFYTSSVDYDWSGTVTPSLAGYAFTPASRSYSNVTSDQANQDYTAALAPALELTSPNGWEHWTLGSTKSITWNAVNYTGTVRLVLFKAGKRFGNIVANIPATAGSYSWTVGLTYDSGMAPEGADYRLYLRSTDGTLIDPSDYRLALIDAAQLEVTSPNGGESWELGTTRNITWNANGYVGTVRLILFQKAAKIGQIVASLPADQGSYAWTVGTHQAGVAPAGINYSIRLLAGDGSQEDFSDGPLTLIENDALIVDHQHTTLNAIPSQWLDQASQEKLLVLSAKSNDAMSLGLRLLGDRDARLTPVETSNSLGLVLTEGSWLPQGAAFELQEWRWSLEKAILDSQATVVIIRPDEHALLTGRLNAESYLSTLNELANRLPGVKLVCSTVALDEPNDLLAKFNRQVRESVLQNKGTLFDAADIESWRNNQQQLANEVPVRHPAYRAAMGAPATDNLANQGSATWWLLARLSGWEGKEAEE